MARKGLPVARPMHGSPAAAATTGGADTGAGASEAGDRRIGAGLTVGMRDGRGSESGGQEGGANATPGVGMPGGGARSSLSPAVAIGSGRSVDAAAPSTG